jgi:tetratricopeptide (TPR) repeat protein
MKIIDPHKPFLHLLLIILLSLLAYSNTFHAPFHFDDAGVIVENPVIKDLRYFAEPSRAKQFSGFFEYPGLKNRYIGYLTFALNYRLHGLHVTGYHAVNLLIHVVNALLLYLLVLLTFQTPVLKTSPLRSYEKHIALFTALLFACHPIQTQAVTYIWQRVTSLATLFCLLSFVTYIQWRLINQRNREPCTRQYRGEHSLRQDQSSRNRNSEKKQKKIYLNPVLWYLTSVFSAVLAMKIKEIAFTLPLTVTLYEFLFFQGSRKRRLICLVPLLLTMLIIPLTLLDIDKPLGEFIGDAGEELRGSSTLSRWHYLLAEFRVMVTYLRLIFFPVNQNLDYDYPRYHSFFNIEVFVSFLLLLSLLGISIFIVYRYGRTAPHSRLLSFGIFWFFINLALESSIIPLSNVIFEHRMYLPSVGIFLAISSGMFMVSEGVRDRLRGIDKVVVATLVAVVVVLTGAAYARNRVWTDDVSLWQDVVSKSPYKERGYNNLGNALMSQGLIKKAIQHYQTAIQLNPDYPKAQNNLGNAYNAQGLFDKAVEHYKIAIQLRPDFADAHYNLGNAYQSQGLVGKAIEQYLITIQLVPYYQRAHYNIGLAYKSKGLIDRAIQHYKTAIRLKPDDAKAHNNLGNAYRSQGLIERAMQHYQIAIQLNPDYPDPHINLGNAFQSQGLTDKAIGHYQTAIELYPGSMEAHYNLSVAYRSKGLLDKAREHFETSARLREEGDTQP